MSSDQSSRSNEGDLGNNRDQNELQEQQQQHDNNNNVGLEVNGAVSSGTSNSSSLQQAAAGGNAMGLLHRHQVAAPANHRQLEAGQGPMLVAQQQPQQINLQARQHQEVGLEHVMIASSSESEQVKVAKAAKARYKRESDILYSLPDPVLAIDICDGEITFANKRMTELLRIDAKDLIGANVETFVAPDYLEGFQKHVRSVVDREDENASDAGDEGTEAGEDSNVKRNDGSNSNGSEPNSEAKVDPGEGVADLAKRLTKQRAYKIKGRSSSGTGSSEEEMPPAKKAKVNADDVSGLHATAEDPGNKKMEEEADLKPPANQIQLQASFRSKHHISSTGTSSSPTGGTSSSPTEKQESSSANSALDKGKETSSNSSDKGYRGSNDESQEEMKGSSQSTKSNTAKADAAPQKEGDQEKLPLAPSQIICLVRKDASEVWCEFTASYRSFRIGSISNDDMEETEEVLLCFHPITEGPPNSDITSSSDGDSGEAHMVQDDS